MPGIRPLISATVMATALSSAAIVGCGGGSGASPGGHDAGGDDVISVGPQDATTTEAGDDSGPSGADGAPDGSPAIDATPPTDADAGDAATGDGSAGDAGDAGYACTPATFQYGCPPVACMTVSGCVANVCQYTSLTPCVARSFRGAFSSGEIDTTVGTTTLHGNISEFRPDDGLVCAGTMCITGGITP